MACMAEEQAKPLAAGPYAIMMYGTLADNQLIPNPAGSANAMYVGSDFLPTTTPFPWNMIVGRYNNVYGYWIFRGDLGCAWQGPLGNPPQKPPAGPKCQCWTLPNVKVGIITTASTTLAYWNKDGQATGNPEDFELFNLNKIPHINAYTINNLRVSAGSEEKYIAYTNGAFQCSGDSKNCAVFSFFVA